MTQLHTPQLQPVPSHAPAARPRARRLSLLVALGAMAFAIAACGGDDDDGGDDAAGTAATTPAAAQTELQQQWGQYEFTIDQGEATATIDALLALLPTDMPRIEDPTSTSLLPDEACAGGVAVGESIDDPDLASRVAGIESAAAAAGWEVSTGELSETASAGGMYEGAVLTLSRDGDSWQVQVRLYGEGSSIDISYCPTA